MPPRASVRSMISDRSRGTSSPVSCRRLIQESDAQWRAKRDKRSGKPITDALYTVQDAIDTLELLVPDHLSCASCTSELESEYKPTG